MNPTMTTTRTLTHVSLDVRDLDRAIDFYTRFLGQAPSKERSDYAKFTLAEPGLVLSLNSAPSRPAGNGGLSHLGIVVESDEELRAAHARVTSAGITIELEEESVTCCYAVQDKFWVRDPDGNAWEIYHFLSDADARDVPVNAAAGTSACCAGGTVCDTGA